MPFQQVRGWLPERPDGRKGQDRAKGLGVRIRRGRTLSGRCKRLRFNRLLVPLRTWLAAARQMNGGYITHSYRLKGKGLGAVLLPEQVNGQVSAN